MLIQTTVLSLTASTLSLKREICSGSDNKISTMTIDEKGPLLSVMIQARRAYTIYTDMLLQPNHEPLP